MDKIVHRVALNTSVDKVLHLFAVIEASCLEPEFLNDIHLEENSGFQNGPILPFPD